MTYDQRGLAREAYSRLLKNPGLLLKCLAEDCGVDRHTLNHAIKAHYGLTWRQLRFRSLLECLSGLESTSPPMHRKNLAHQLGYGSARSLARARRAAERSQR